MKGCSGLRRIAIDVGRMVQGVGATQADALEALAAKLRALEP